MLNASQAQLIYRWLLGTVLACGVALVALHAFNLVASWGAMGTDPSLASHGALGGGPLTGALSVVGLAATVPGFVFGALAWTHPRLCRGASVGVTIAALSGAYMQRIAPQQSHLWSALCSLAVLASLALCLASVILRRKDPNL